MQYHQTKPSPTMISSNKQNTSEVVLVRKCLRVSDCDTWETSVQCIRADKLANQDGLAGPDHDQSCSRSRFSLRFFSAVREGRRAQLGVHTCSPSPRHLETPYLVHPMCPPALVAQWPARSSLCSADDVAINKLERTLPFKSSHPPASA